MELPPPECAWDDMNGALTRDPHPRQSFKVCLLVDSVKEEAGTEKLVVELAKRIDATRFEVHVCCFENSARLADLGSWVRVSVWPVNRLYSPAGLHQIWKFRQYLKQNRIALVHGFMNKSAMFGVLASIGSPSRAVITSRLNTGYWYTPRSLTIFRLLNRYTTHIFANSICAKNITVAMERVSPDKIAVVYQGVDLVRFGSSNQAQAAAASLKIPEAVPVVGIVATYRPVKNLALFLEAARIVLQVVPNAAFLLVGHGELKTELEALAVELGVRKSVFFSNGQGAVPDYLARMSVACLTSRSEGLPNAILEYMAAGLPVVATDVGGVSELVEDGVTGYLVRDHTPEAVSEPIIRLLQDEILRVRMGQLGRERARAQFDISAAVRRLEDFYLSAIAEREH